MEIIENPSEISPELIRSGQAFANNNFENSKLVDNNSDIDRASAIDMWFIKFKTVHVTPGWYWTKTPFIKDKSKKKMSGPDRKRVVEEFELTDNEFDFLQKHFEDDVDYELKILKRWDKKK
jgi:hypothetical protein